jgi:hypothetical protein
MNVELALLTKRVGNLCADRARIRWLFTDN